jgi:hypothetical protein
VLVDHWGPVGKPTYQFGCGFLQLCFKVMPVDVVNVIRRLDQPVHKGVPLLY